ncbi:MAG: dihydropteroate synthase [Bacteroidetes bacterium]|nr:dihydropteroate synthase [Bacteroidota bacterium]
MRLKCRDRSLDFHTPLIMGILNLSPDSLYDGGKSRAGEHALNQTERMLREGAEIIDLGGMSSRPGAEIISVEEELERVIPVLRQIRYRFSEAIISIDTIHAKVAEEALQIGAHIINDISGGTYEPEIIKIAARHKAAFIIMHKKGNPVDMQENPQYEQVVQEVKAFLAKQVEQCQKAGLTDLVIDPGFGFGKTVEHNYTLLRHLDSFLDMNLPLMVGLSRKAMICKPLGIHPESALNGTTALHTIALTNGANILRVHDVKEAKEVIRLYQACYPPSEPA